MKKIFLILGIILAVALVSATVYPEAWGNDVDAGDHNIDNVNNITAVNFLGTLIGTRCYFEDTYKICSEGWQKLETGAVTGPEELYEAPEPANGKKWSCNPEGCVAI